MTRPAWTPPTVLPLWQLLTLAALSLWLYAPTLFRLVMNWKNDPNYSHGFFVPLFSAYVVWTQRHRLAALPIKPSLAGLFLVALSECILITGQLGAELFLARFSLLLMLAGLIILFLGWDHLRALAFPLAFLALMIPFPMLIFNQITFPLQLLASRLGSNILANIFAIPVLRVGNILHLASMDLQVAEACSGIRSLISLTTLSIIYGYLMEPRIIVRVVLALAAVPIAVIANALRIVATGLLVQYWSPDAAEGFLHFSSGVLIFVVCLLMLYGLHQALRRSWKAPAEQAKPANS